jgi:hypothetical protein
MEKSLTKDSRNQMNGHDFINLLRIFNKRCLKMSQKYCDDEIVEGAIYSCCDANNLINERLFMKLIKWAQ